MPPCLPVPGRSSRASTAHASLQRPLQIWGGVECSVLRVGEDWRDQMRETGHEARITDDLARLAALGLAALRYPVLWEHVSPDHPDRCAWARHDLALGRLRALGVAPIVGLVHHGSGPGYTDLLDPGFAPGLARHAARVAARYPWVEHWTPVNEPLTTARFSGLYGHWFPHGAESGAFLLMLAHQCHAVLLAMRAIRRVIPRARLVQTEDIGRTFSARLLAYQAAHENERRWLSLDLLCGRVDRAHPFHAPLLRAGVPAALLDELATGEAAPDLVGVNHYVTSERFLDHRLGLYPPHLHGGNGRHAYVDTEAVRVPLDDVLGWQARLREVWERYRRPMAITEVHLACPDPEEPVRWLLQAWRAAEALRAEGADVRAVTAWALLGSTDWSSLLRERAGDYEPGAFDARHEPPAPTPLAQALAELARTGACTHPALRQPGWWERDGRYHAARAA